MENNRNTRFSNIFFRIEIRLFLIKQNYMFLINGDFQKDDRIFNSFFIQSNQIPKIYF